MKEIKTIIAHYDSWKNFHINMAMAIVVEVKQSSYRREGARMLIAPNGDWVGGISGGCLEGDIKKQAKKVIISGQPKLVTYDTRDGDESQIGIGLGCNGLINILVIPINTADKHNGIELLKRFTAIRSPILLKWYIRGDQVSVESDKLSRSSSIKSSFKYLTTEDHFVFEEKLGPVIRVYIFGSNYDTIPLCRLIAELGWESHIISPLKKISQTLYSYATSISEEFDISTLDDFSVCILMSHDFKTDLSNLQKILPSSNYIGLLGPKKRKEKLEESLGFKLSEKNIFGPVGLDIGANTPEEIGVSIVAEICSFFRGRDGSNLRERKAPIHS